MKSPTLYLLALLSLACTLSAAEPTMIGYRGNGIGLFPADCTPVTTWQECTFKQVATGEEKKGRPVLEWVKDQDAPINIVWKKDILTSCNGGMVVAGGKLFMMNDRGGAHYATQELPDFIGVELICVDPASGEILWKRDCNHQEQLPENLRAQAEADVKVVASYYPTAYNAFLAFRRVAGPLIGGGHGMPNYSGDEKHPRPEGYAEKYAQAAEAFAKVWPAVPMTMEAFTATQAKSARTWTWNYAQLAFGIFTKKYFSEISEAKNRLGRYGYAYCAWFGLGDFVGSAMPTPVSDGQHIYVYTGFNDVHCFDLDGNKKWTHYFGPNKDHHGSCLGSPILVGDKLVVHGGSRPDKERSQYLTVFDKHSGKVLWEQVPRRAGYSTITPVHLALPIADSGEILDVVWTGGGQLWRLDDGKLLLDSDQVAYTGDGRHVAVDREKAIIVLDNGKNDGGNASPKVWKLGFLAMQFKATSKDEVTVKQLWSNPDGVNRPVAKDGVVYGFPKRKGSLTAYDIVTGKELRSTKHQQRDTRTPMHLTVIAGTHLFALDGDGTCMVFDLDKPEAKPLLNRLGTQYLTGNSSFNQGAQPFFSGNRIFIRSYREVYCIGNPEEAMRLSPAHVQSKE